jgi:hypothetical protein
MPFELKTGTNVIVQQETPYNDGCMLTINAGRMNLYHKSAGAGTVIAINAFTQCIKQYRWHDLLAFFDMPRQEAALFCNGKLLQRTHIGTATIVSADGWTVGAIPSLLSAPGLYQRFLMGHGASLSIEDALEMAVASYYDDADPPGTTFKAMLADGTGTTLASSVPDTTAGTLTVTTGGWVTSGRYGKDADDGFIKPRFDSRIANVTAAYTATYQELVKCDPSGGAFTVTLPTAVGHDGKQIAFVNMTTSTNEVTLDGNASETINGSTTLAGLNTSRGSRVIEAREGNWVTVAVS